MWLLIKGSLVVISNIIISVIFTKFVNACQKRRRKIIKIFCNGIIWNKRNLINHRLRIPESKSSAAFFWLPSNWRWSLFTTFNFFKSDQKAKESLLESEHLITETLAQIYAFQGNINKAIRAYEILSLKFPQKSVYFASLIEKLKTNK